MEFGEFGGRGVEDPDSPVSMGEDGEYGEDEGAFCGLDEEEGGFGFDAAAGLGGGGEGESESDSDDSSSLEAFDMTDDMADLSKHKRPVYLRECLGALKPRDDADILESTLPRLAAIIGASFHEELVHVARDLAAALLFLQDQFCLAGFAEQRHAAMVALVSSAAKQVVPYFTAQFYSPNHSLRDRLDILEVLVDGARRMADLDLPLSSAGAAGVALAGALVPPPTQPSGQGGGSSKTEETADEARARRAQGQCGRVVRQSARLASGGASSGPATNECRFGEVAGLFT